MNYIAEAIRTESIDLFKVERPRLFHAAIGIMTETAEVLVAYDDPNLKEELGDILWYVAIACDEMQITIDELLTVSDLTVEGPEMLLSNAEAALDHMKKVCFYGVMFDDLFFAQKIANVVQMVTKLSRWPLVELQEANIAKLRRRYPDKFTTDAAVNRDLAAEREVMVNA